MHSSNHFLLLNFILLVDSRVAPIAKLFVSILYENPKNEVQWNARCDFWDHDKNCDVYFKICLGTEEKGGCNLLITTTPVYMDKTSVKIDGKNSLEIPLHKNVPENISIKIDAWDHDTITGDDLIGNFDAFGKLNEFITSGKFISMKRIDRDNRKGKEIRVLAKFQLLCEEHRFGENCETICIPKPWTYTCDKNGKKICDEERMCNGRGTCRVEKNDSVTCVCNAPWTGRYCDLELIVTRHEEPTNAVIIPRHEVPCKNGTEEICSGHGTCHAVDDNNIICVCNDSWTGDQCEMELKTAAPQYSIDINNISRSEIFCLNGVTYANTSNGDICVCQDGWEGDRCEIKVQSGWRYSIILILSITLSIAVLIGASLTIIWKANTKGRKSKGIVYRTFAGRKLAPNSVQTPQTLSDYEIANHVYAECGEPYYFKSVGEVYDSEEFKRKNDLFSELAPKLPPRNN